MLLLARSIMEGHPLSHGLYRPSSGGMATSTASGGLAPVIPSAQCMGLSWGFTFHGHFKAVKCADIEASFAKVGLNTSDYSQFQALPGTTLNKFIGNAATFRLFWNAYAITKDYHDSFAPPDTCTIGPCNNSTQCDPKDN